MPTDPKHDFIDRFFAATPPGEAFDVAMAAHRRNIQALQEAGRVWTDGARAVIERRLELMREYGEDMATLASRDAFDAESQAKRIEELRAIYEKSVASMREISDIASKSAQDAASVLQSRALETFDEIATAMKDAGVDVAATAGPMAANPMATPAAAAAPQASAAPQAKEPATKRAAPRRKPAAAKTAAEPQASVPVEAPAKRAPRKTAAAKAASTKVADAKSAEPKTAEPKRAAKADAAAAAPAPRKASIKLVKNDEGPADAAEGRQQDKANGARPPA